MCLCANTTEGHKKHKIEHLKNVFYRYPFYGSRPHMNIFKMCIQCNYNQFYITMISVKYEIEKYIMHNKKGFLGNCLIPKSWFDTFQ